jgi:hypothetical protein
MKGLYDVNELVAPAGVVNPEAEIHFRGSYCFAKSAHSRIKRASHKGTSVDRADMGSVAEFKFFECLGRKPISLVTVLVPKLGG